MLKIAFSCLHAKLRISEKNIINVYLINHSDFYPSYLAKFDETIFDNNHIIMIDNAKHIEYLPDTNKELIQQVEYYLLNNSVTWEPACFFDASNSRR